MTAFTIHIENNEQLNAFKDLAKSLNMNFTISDNETHRLTSEIKSALDEGLIQIDENKIISHEDALKKLKQKHPKYFNNNANRMD